MSTLNVAIGEVRQECSRAGKAAEDLQRNTQDMVRRFNASPITGSRKADQVRDEMSKVQRATDQAALAFQELSKAMKELVDELDRVAN